MDTAVKVHSEGTQIVLDFETLADALRLWKPWTDAVRRLEVTEVLHRGLAAAGLSLQLRVQGRTVADLGGEEKSGIALRLLEALTPTKHG